ncbi:hypothetical protein [Hyalangium rubrum]|uniref:Outer membrane protein beta-barrel domain-containing protein n=1 Tax=Hyalangium rubrum TaxID=3103134 RepID=A0ABU5H929_9BACT|nr:hypothetical protein [Hyalangium sp. s54d21]MDY7229998.1 hypothetical protein [Hyalangium sp. s54d21]
MRALLLTLVLGASLTARAQGLPPSEPYAPPARLLVNEVRTQVGLLVGGYGFEGGGWDDAFFLNSTSGHYLFGGFTAEAGLLSLVPLERGGPQSSYALSARLGYTGERWSVLAGPVLQATYPGSPLIQVLPSVKGRYRLGEVTLDAAVLDQQGMVPAHVGATYGPVGLAYVLPLGARAHARIPLSPRVALLVEGFAFRLSSARSAMLTVGIVGIPPSSRSGATP